MNDLIGKVLTWATARQIIQHSNSQTQLLKTVSELGELSDAVLKKDRAGIMDGIGDVLVTLIIVAELERLGIDECLAAAYNEIKDRRGRLTAEGVFVKEEAA